jgi:Flp pilus assembly pilin Flp
MESIMRFMREETGVTAAEYGIILGCIAAAVITAIGLFYTNLGNVFDSWAQWFGAAKAPAVPPAGG